MKLTEFCNNNWPLPDIVTNKSQDGFAHCLDFVLINKNISIKITHLQDHVFANSILQQVATEVPNVSNGFSVEFYIDGKQSVQGNPIEYVIFNILIKIITEYFIQIPWTYIIFVCKSNEPSKLHNGIAQRLTITQPNVERFIHFNNNFLIARF